MIITITGPSGVGKTTLANQLGEIGLHRVVTYTSRSPRAGEVDGIHYMFRSREQIESYYNEGRLWEISEFCGNLYGSPELSDDVNYCVVVDSNGAMAYKKHYGPQCITVLLLATQDALQERIDKRAAIDSSLTVRPDEVVPSLENFDIVVDTTDVFPDAIADFVVDCMYVRAR